MSSTKVKKNLETVGVTKVAGVSATEAAAVAQSCRQIANDPEASQEVKSRASYWAGELDLVTSVGAAQRREYLVGQAATFAANAAGSA